MTNESGITVRRLIELLGPLDPASVLYIQAYDDVKPVRRILVDLNAAEELGISSDYGMTNFLPRVIFQ